MNYALKHNKLDIIINNPDKIFINFSNNKESKDNFDHFFELSLMDVEHETLLIPEVDYDVEFTMDAKKFGDLISELMVFGPNLNIRCTEDLLELNSNGDTGKLKVNIPIDDLSTYSIVEGQEIVLTYSLTYINKMCITNKLSTDIDFYISNECPMKIQYNLGEDSSMMFYMAPKMNE